jgi:hypothetical protein
LGWRFKGDAGAETKERLSLTCDLEEGVCGRLKGKGDGEGVKVDVEDGGTHGKTSLREKGEEALGDAAFVGLEPTFGERFEGLREGFVGKATLDVAAEGGEEVFVLAVVVDAMFGIEDEIEAHGGGIGREAFGPTEGERIGILNRAEEECVGGGPVGVIRFGVGLVKTATLRATIPPPNEKREEGDGDDTDEIVKQIGHG